jgi:archaellum component FlaC
MDEIQRQTDVCKDDIMNMKNSLSAHNWDINELKAQVYELKNHMADVQAKLNNLNDDFYSRTYDIDIEALYKK